MPDKDEFNYETPNAAEKESSVPVSDEKQSAPRLSKKQREIIRGYRAWLGYSRRLIGSEASTGELTQTESASDSEWSYGIVSASDVDDDAVSGQQTPVYSLTDKQRAQILRLFDCASDRESGNASDTSVETVALVESPKRLSP